MYDRQEELYRSFSQAFDQCFKQCLLRIKVVIERSFRNLEGVEDILDGHLLIPFSIDELLRDIKDFVAPDGIFFNDSGHVCLHLYKPTVGLYYNKYS